MTMEELMSKRSAFKAAVLALLQQDPSLSYEEIGHRAGVTLSRVYQIRKEAGLPARMGRTLFTRKADVIADGPHGEAQPDSER